MEDLSSASEIEKSPKKSVITDDFIVPKERFTVYFKKKKKRKTEDNDLSQCIDIEDDSPSPLKTKSLKLETPTSKKDKQEIELSPVKSETFSLCSDTDTKHVADKKHVRKLFDCRDDDSNMTSKKNIDEDSEIDSWRKLKKTKTVSSEVEDSSSEKRKKHKKKKFLESVDLEEFKTEGLKTENVNVIDKNEQDCFNEVPDENTPLNNDSNTIKKHKKKRSNSFNAEPQETTGPIDVNEDVTTSKKHKKKKHKSNYTECIDLSQENGFTSNEEASITSKKHKKKKHKSIDTECIDLSQENASNEETSITNKHKKKKKRESNDSVEEHEIIGIVNEILNFDNGAVENEAVKLEEKSITDNLNDTLNGSTKKHSKKHKNEVPLINESVEKKHKTKRKPGVVLLNGLIKQKNPTKDQYWPKLDLSATHNGDLESSTRVDALDLDSSLLQKILALNIIVPFDVPRLHRISTRSSKPSKQEQEEIKMLQLEVKSGPYGKAEDEQIKSNWFEFCKLHDLEPNPAPFMQLRHKYVTQIKQKELAKFLQFLGKGLENRMLCSVHARFKRLFLAAVTKTGPFSKKEDEIIVNYIEKSGIKWYYSELSRILNRERRSIEKRYKFLQNKSNDSFSQKKWNQNLIVMFIRRIMKVTKCKNTEDLKNLPISLRQWERIAKKMPNFTARQLQRKWSYSLHARLFCTETTEDVKRQLIKRLHKKSCSDWRELNWHKIARKFEGSTPDKLYSTLKNMVVAHVPKEKRDDLRQCLEILYEKFIRQQIRPKSHRVLKIEKVD